MASARTHRGRQSDPDAAVKLLRGSPLFVHRQCGSGDQAGVALVVVLWMLALLSVLAVGFVGNARTNLLIARNQYEQAQARALAEAGMQLAILGVLDPSLFPGWRLDG